MPLQPWTELDESLVRWDLRFLAAAAFTAQWSKDPSSKVGTVIARGKNRIADGYNGFPKGVLDLPQRYADRAEKYPRTVHAETNAVVSCRASVEGATLYCTHPTCSTCAGVMIQAGIIRVVSHEPDLEFRRRWHHNLGIAEEMLAEAHVVLTYYPPLDAVTLRSIPR